MPIKEKKLSIEKQIEEARVKDFIDLITPSTMKFNTDHFICGNTYRCVWTVRDYQTSTEDQAILRGLGEKDGITLKIYTRHVTPTEEKKIISGATKKNRLNAGNTDDLKQSIVAESNLQDVITLIATMHKDKEPLIHGTYPYRSMANRIGKA